MGDMVVPSPNDVRYGILVDEGSGNFIIPAESSVLNGIGYGSNTIEFFGTYIGSGLIIIDQTLDLFTKGYISTETDTIKLVRLEYSLEEPVSIIGSFDTGKSVTIELWSHGILQTIISNICNEIGNTGKYSWSISNIPVINKNKKMYRFRMTDNLFNIVEGDFILNSIEGRDRNMPSLNNKDSYIIKI
jgi:hypothetical protein